MENQFLREVARAYVAYCGADLEVYTFVFPNRRSLKFFTKYLGEAYGRTYGMPLLAPALITINDLFGELSGLSVVDPVEALYILYRHYMRLKPKSGESFDEFVHWGGLIIKDFDDIDKYRVNASQLFTNIRDLKQLDSDFSFLSPTQRTAVESFWRNFLRGEFSDKKDFFASTWNVMYELYRNFREELLEKKVGYEGLIYRQVAEFPGSDLPQRKFVFIGLNAPNSCERALMTRLRDSGRGDFYWDFYGPLLTNPQNSASVIIRGCVRDYPSRFELSGQDFNTVPQINVIGVPSGVGQAFVAARILSRIAADSGAGGMVSKEVALGTAVVLPDEKLLMPVLNSIPAEYDSINVTMGYPVAATGLISFMNQVGMLQREVKELGGEYRFYHRSLMRVLSHEYIKKMAGNPVSRLKKWVVEGNRIYISAEDLGQQTAGGKEADLLSLVFRVVETTEEIIDYQIAILKELDGVLPSLDREFIYQYYLRINRLKELNIPMERETYFRFISQITAGMTVPFRGEPLSGLQVMGSLEVRALDFDNVIIISANEGTFPASNAAQSLIPYNLRLGFGLPTYELQDGIAAYHFYRSIARAKQVFLVYDTRSEGMNSGEVSRYVKQLKYHFNLEISERVAAAAPVKEAPKQVALEKSPHVMDLLLNKYVKSDYSALSASAVNNYIACPLKFYFENVEGIREEEEVAESVESNTFGSLFHNAVQRIYDAYKYEVVSEAILRKESADEQNLDRVIREEFKALLHVGEIAGQNIIIAELLKKYLRLTFREDEQHVPFIYLSGEELYRYGLPVYDGETVVNFKAFVDRIDELEDKTLRIIDYKTGGVEKPGKNFEIPDLFDKTAKIRHKALLQLYLYALIVTDTQQRCGQLRLRNGSPLEFKVEDDFSQLELVIYPLRKIKNESVFKLRIYRRELELFREQLRLCVEEIFNPEVPFFPNPDGGACEYCKFKALCGR